MSDNNEQTEQTQPEASAPAQPQQEVPETAALSQADNDEANYTVFTPLPPCETVELSHEVLQQGVFQPGTPHVFIAPDTADRVDDVTSRMPAQDVEKNTPAQRWIHALRNSIYAHPMEGFYGAGFFDNSKRTFRQGVQAPDNSGVLDFAKPKLQEPINGAKLDGEAANIHMRSLLGLTHTIRVPMWHSGFWMSLRAPDDGALLELNRRITETKIELGRRTVGMAYSNHLVFTMQHMVDFIMDHLYATTLLPDTLAKANNDIRNLISALDIPMMVWGMACLIWPRGFNYTRPIFSKDGIATNNVEGVVNIAKMMLEDTASFTDWQRRHMTKKFGASVTWDELQKYRSEFSRGFPREEHLKMGSATVSFRLRVPTVAQFLKSGVKWVDSIVAIVDQAFGIQPDEDARNNYILEQSKAFYMRQYAHWVERITAYNGPVDDEGTRSNFVEDEEEIDKLLDTLSTQDTLREGYYEMIRKYMEDSTVAIIAVPRAEGDEMDKERTRKLPRYPHWISIDPVSTFFILLGQKVGFISTR